MKSLFTAIILALFFQTLISAQTVPQSVYISRSGRQRSAQEVRTMMRVRELQRRNARFGEMEATANGNQQGSVTVSRTSPELAKKAKNYIAFDPSIQTKYQDFLKTPKTGIVMLLSDKACSADVFGKKTSLNELIKHCPANFIEGNGKFFSFRQGDYVEYDIADIGIKDNFIFSFGTANQGILVELGDLDLQEISLESKGVDYLTKFNPALTLEGTVRDSELFENRVQNDGFDYGKITTIEENTTYALRVVAYTPYYLLENPKKKSKPFKVSVIKHDNRDDIIVAFRVVKKAEDGSVVLVWKELRRTDAPELMIPVKQNSGIIRSN